MRTHTSMALSFILMHLFDQTPGVPSCGVCGVYSDTVNSLPSGTANPLCGPVTPLRARATGSCGPGEGPGALLRKAFIVVPLTLLLPAAGFGVTGVFLAEPISNIIGGIACYATMRLTIYKKLN